MRKEVESRGRHINLIEAIGLTKVTTLKEMEST